MVDFNLLAWRTLEENYKKQTLKKMLVATFIGSFIFLIFIHFILQTYLHHKQIHLAALEKRLTLSTHSMHFARADAEHLEYLFKESEFPAQFFTALTQIDAQHIAFNNVKRQKHTIYFSGQARSLADLSNFLKHSTLLSLFSEIKIIELKNLPTHIQFQLIALENTH